MTEDQTVLKKKAAGAGGLPGLAAMTPDKAMRLAFGRTGRDRPGLGLRLAGFEMSRISIFDLVGQSPEQALVMTMVRGTDTGGALVADPGVISALIEAETMGRVGKLSPDPRAPTRIDALIAGAFFDAALTLFDEVAGDLALAPALTGWRSGEMLTAAKVLPLVLDDKPLRLIRLGFEFAEGDRTGEALLALRHDAPVAAVAPGSDAGGFTRDLGRVVMGAPAEVRAVLCRMTLSLDRVTGWEPGTVVPLPRGALGKVRLEDIDGGPVARGRLGQMSGMRAVRLSSPDED